MKNTISKEASITQIAQYKEMNREKGNRYEARVLISADGKRLFDGWLYVAAIISKKDAGIIIEGNNEYVSKYLPKYTVKDGSFEIIHNTLIIRTKNIWDRPITVEITAK